MPEQSPFAAALEGVLLSIGAPFPTIAVWMGSFTTVEQIEKWITDQSVPSPDQLWRLVSILRDCHAPEDPGKKEFFHAARAEFARVLDERGSRISPLGKRFLGTPGKYMLESQREAFDAQLATLPVRRQEEILRQVMTLVFAHLDEPSDRGILDPLPD